MIVALTFITNPHPPIQFHQLKPGDWFTFDDTTTNAVWVMGNRSRAICLRTGAESDYIFASRQKVWLVKSWVTVRGREPSAEHLAEADVPF